MLIVYVPGSRRRVLQRRIARRPWREIEAGATLHIGRAKLRVTAVERSIERRDDCTQHVTSILTRAVRRSRKRVPSNVVPMPRAGGTPLTDFLRYHVLVRVFDGDVDAWIEQLTEEGDIRFARRVRTRLREDPAFLVAVRRMVDATLFWGDTRVS